MKLTLICEHGTRTVEFEGGDWQPTVNSAFPVCPYCDMVERPKAEYHALGWVGPKP